MKLCEQTYDVRNVNGKWRQCLGLTHTHTLHSVGAIQGQKERQKSEKNNKEKENEKMKKKNKNNKINNQ